MIIDLGALSGIFDTTLIKDNNVYIGIDPTSHFIATNRDGIYFSYITKDIYTSMQEAIKELYKEEVGETDSYDQVIDPYKKDTTLPINDILRIIAVSKDASLIKEVL